MIWKLGLLFTIVPLVETFVLIKVGSVIGPLPTVLLLLVDGLLGAWLAKREGLAVIRQLSADLAKGLPPATHLVEGLLIIVGAVLLVTPGFTTDIVGALLLFPPSRRFLAPHVLRSILKRFNIEGVRIGPAGPVESPLQTPQSERRGTPFDHPVR